MMNRRVFGKMMAAVAVRSIATGSVVGQTVERRHHGEIQVSVMMWTLKDHGSFEENLERVARAGYHHVELVNEFKKWSEEDTRRILARMQVLDISVDAMAGMTRGFADPSGGDAFLSELKSLIPVARRIRCGKIILLSGKRIAGAAAEGQHKASIETLKRCAEVLKAADLVGVIEPIDRLENPTIYLDGVDEAFEMTRAVDSPNVRVLYDFYHEQRGLGNLIEKLDKNIDEVGLVHIADVPGRHEPGTGEVNYGNIYRKLAQLNYKGVIAMEFYPTGDVVETLRRAQDDIVRLSTQFEAK